MIALARMPRPARSSEAVRVSPRSAHLLAVYAAATCPLSAATEHTLTMEPPSAISGTSAWMPSSGPVTLTSKARRQASSGTFGSRSRPAIPALFTSPCTTP